MDPTQAVQEFADLDPPALAAFAQARAHALDLDIDLWREEVVEALKGLQAHAGALARALVTAERSAS